VKKNAEETIDVMTINMHINFRVLSLMFLSPFSFN